MEHIITAGKELRKSFYESGFNFLSSVPQRRIQELLLRKRKHPSTRLGQQKALAGTIPTLT